MWVQIAVWVALTVISYLMRPKADSQKPKPVKNIDVPTAEDGREIPVLFGTRPLKNANIVWFGDLKTKPIKSKSGKK
jgi:hypothetical protein